MPIIFTIVLSLWPLTVRSYAPIIERASLHYHADPNLVAAIIWNESRGDKEAYRWEEWIGVPSVGLMQIAAFDWRPGLDYLRDPAHNIWYGTAILKTVMRQTEDVETAVAVYNFGLEGVLANRCGKFGGRVYASKVLKDCRQFGGCPITNNRLPTTNRGPR